MKEKVFFIKMNAKDTCTKKDKLDPIALIGRPFVKIGSDCADTFV